MRHMGLEEWDRRVAPYLATIGIRARHIKQDAKQIRDWVGLLPVAPDFPTEAIELLKEAMAELQVSEREICLAINEYETKEKVK